eukprot:gene11787-14908_t
MICSTLQWLVEHRERERLKSAAHKAQTAQDELAALGDDVPDWLRERERLKFAAEEAEEARDVLAALSDDVPDWLSDSTKHVVGTKSGGGDKVPQATATTSEVDELEQYVIKDGAGQRAGVGSKWRPPESGPIQQSIEGDLIGQLSGRKGGLVRMQIERPPEKGKECDEFGDQLLTKPLDVESLLSPSSAQQIQLLIRVVAGLSKVLTQPNQATENISDLPGVHQAPNHGPQARHHNTEPDSRTSQPSQTAEEQASRQHQNGEPNSRTSQPSQQQQQASRQHQNGEPNSRTSQPRQAAGEVASCRQQQQNRPARPQNKADKADSKSLAAPARVLSANDFLFDSGLDNVNLWGLLRWVKDSKVLLKVSSYAQSVEVTTTSSSSRDSSVNLTGVLDQREDSLPDIYAATAFIGALTNADSPQPPQPPNPQSLGVLDQRVDRLSALHAVTAFMGALTNADSDGRVIVSVPPRSSVRSQKGALPNEEVPSLKYILLDAAVHFAKVLSGARSVVLASGTLSPVQGLIQQLFPAMSLERD